MTIKELKEVKVVLDEHLTDAVRKILFDFYKTNGIMPSGINTSIDLVEIKLDYNEDPISSCIDVVVKSNFNLA